MNFLKKSFLLIIIITSILLNREVSGERLYSWTDKQGVVHYSEKNAKEFSFEEESSDKTEPTDFQSSRTIENSNIKSAPQNPIESAIKSTFTIKNGKNSGTGFFISSNGYAITCRHVVKEGQDHIAVLHNQEQYPIGIIAASDNFDLALIMVLGPMDNPFLNIRQSAPDPGEEIYAIKGPAGHQSEVIHGTYAGIRKKEGSEDSLLQFSAQVNPGNSGGPLVDMTGQVAGVVSWKIISKKGIPVYGEAFAIPSKYILEEYEKYLE